MQTPMQEWLYRASNTKANADDTRELVEHFGFICRSAFVDDTKTQMIANVGKVDFGDIIHMYFVDASGGRPLGAYRVVAPPQTYFIDREGIVRSIQIGEVGEAD